MSFFTKRVVLVVTFVAYRFWMDSRTVLSSSTGGRLYSLHRTAGRGDDVSGGYLRDGTCYAFTNAPRHWSRTGAVGGTRGPMRYRLFSRPSTYRWPSGTCFPPTARWRTVYGVVDVDGFCFGPRALLLCPR